MPTLPHLLLALLAALALAFAAWRAGALATSGAIAATIVGFCLFGFAGGRGAVALLLFFVTSSALSRVGKRRKDRLGYEKGGKRDAGQVLANGGIASLAALLLPLVPPSLFPATLAALLGALATANADTWATEIGSLWGGIPRRITDFRPAAPGQSGAISAKGTGAALAGACLIGLCALLWQQGGRMVGIVTLSGFAGALADSLLGATLQAQYRDLGTGRLTERTRDADGTPYPLVSGIAAMNNDAVNLLSTLLGALFAFALAR